MISGLLILNIFLIGSNEVTGSVHTGIDRSKEISGRSSNSHSIYSPSGSIKMVLYVKNDTTHDDILTFDLYVDDTQVMNGSTLGLRFHNDELLFGKGMKIVGFSNNSRNDTYSMPWGERDTYPDVYNSMNINLTTRYDENSSYTLEIRIFDEGAAFRYKLNDGTRTGSVSVTGDLTRYCFTSDHKCLVQYGMEKPYSSKKISTMGSKCMTPLTVEVDNNLLISLHEAYVDSYCRSHLSRVPGSNDISVSMHSSVTKYLPFNTPWRTIILSDSWAELPNHGHIHQALCPETKITNTSWIVTGKAFRDCSLSTQGSKDIIDFCQNHSMQYVHLDAGWYGNEWSNADPRTVSRSGLNLTDVIKYAKERDIGVILYINKRAFSYGTKSILDTYRSWGIKGIKLGFVDGLSKGGIDQIMNIVKEASKRNLIVNIHDNYRPTGMSRTYPNLLTQEGVRGNEQYPTAEENTYLPYTRAVAGPMDYTPMLYTRDTRTTLVHQLSIPHILYSPLTYLYWYQKPVYVNGSKGLQAWDLLPGAWNESISFGGGPGFGSTCARRCNDTWVLSSMNGPKGRLLDMRPSFLENGTTYNATIFRDHNGTIERSYCSVNSSIRVGERMLAGGGSVLVFRKTNTSDISALLPYPPWAQDLNGTVLKKNLNYALDLIVGNGWNLSNYSITPKSNRIGFDTRSGRLILKPDQRDVGNITVSLKINLSDGSILWSNTTFMIIDTNKDPKIRIPKEHTFFEDQESTIHLNATDPETESINLTWTASTNVTFLTHDTLNKSWRGTPKNEDVGTYWMNLTVKDGEGGSDQLNLSIEVIDTNDNPVITSGIPHEALEETNYIFVFTAKDPDPGNDTLKWNMKTDASFLIMDGDTGVMKGLPDDPDVGNHSVSVFVSDGRGGTDKLNFTLIVKPVNDPPLIEKTYLPDIFEDDPFVFQFNPIDPDDDNFFWELHSNASFLGINESSGRISGIPGDTSGGSYFVNVSVSDSSGGRDFLNLSLNVTGINDIPVILGSGEINLVEDSPFIYRFEVSDPDQDTFESFQWNLSAPPFLSIEYRTGRIFGIPRNNDVGSHIIIIKVKDSEGGFSSRNITCNVRNSNDPPMILGEFEEIFSIMEDNDFELMIKAVDVDPTADQFHWEIDEGPWHLISHDSKAMFEWTPGNDDVGIHHVMISVHDGNGGYDILEFDLRVVNVNDPPKIIENFKTNISIIEDYTFTLKLEAIDIDPTSDVLYWKIVEGPMNIS
jgi:alpha-glucosidase